VTKIAALDHSPRFVLVTCLALTLVVTFALLFFEAYGQDAAAVVYQDF
jgi:hypothetical protein